jgi:hypothetical protein
MPKLCSPADTVTECLRLSGTLTQTFGHAESFSYVKGGCDSYVYSPFMFTLAQYHNTLASIEAEIADAELRLAEDLEFLARGREAGAATYELEAQVRNCRFALENLWSLRQQHLGAEVAALGPTAGVTAKPSRGEAAARFF